MYSISYEMYTRLSMVISSRFVDLCDSITHMLQDGVNVTESIVWLPHCRWSHYGDVVMGTVASQTTSSHHCLLDRLFGCRWKKTSKLRVTGLCVGNSPETGEFPAQMASNAENVSFDDVIMVMMMNMDTIGKYLATTQHYNTRTVCLTHALRPRQNGRHFPDDVFKWMPFLLRKYINFDKDFTEVCSQGSN